MLSVLNTTCSQVNVESYPNESMLLLRLFPLSPFGSQTMQKQNLNFNHLVVYLSFVYVCQVWPKEWDEAVIVSNKFREILPKLSDKLLLF